jgi:hypothetical protein
MKRACVPLLSVVMAGMAVAAGVPGATPLRAQGQVSERLPSFEVASVKENR